MAAAETDAPEVPNWERVGGLEFRFAGSCAGEVRLTATRRNALSNARCPMWFIEISLPSGESQDGQSVEEVGRARSHGAARRKMMEWMREHDQAPSAAV